MDTTHTVLIVKYATMTGRVHIGSQVSIQYNTFTYIIYHILGYASLDLTRTQLSTRSKEGHIPNLPGQDLHITE